MAPPKKPPSVWFIFAPALLALVALDLGVVKVIKWLDGIFAFMGRWLMGLSHVGLLWFFLGVILLVAIGFILFDWAIRPFLRRHLRYDRWQRRRCIMCDYDLRTHFAGGKCPECAAEIPPLYMPVHPPPPPSPPPRVRWLVTFLAGSLATLSAYIMLGYRTHDSNITFLITYIYAVIIIWWAHRYERHRRWRGHRCIRCGQPLDASLACDHCGAFAPLPSTTSAKNVAGRITH